MEYHPGSKLHLKHIMDVYEQYLTPVRNDEIAILELGVKDGYSVMHWRDFMPKARIAGLDLYPIPFDDPSGRIKVFEGEQQDRQLLDRVAAEVAPEGFDVIIDDASHIGQYTRIAFWHLLDRHLKPGGLYFVEDWGCSYFKTFVDGKQYTLRPADFAWHEKILNSLKDVPMVRKTPFFRRAVNSLRLRLVKRKFPSHNWGMVGFVKELVDECAAPDVTDDHMGGRGPKRMNKIEWLHMSTGLVVVKKSRSFAG